MIWTELNLEEGHYKVKEKTSICKYTFILTHHCKETKLSQLPH